MEIRLAAVSVDIFYCPYLIIFDLDDLNFSTIYLL